GESGSREADPPVAHERADQHPDERDPPELLVDLHPVRLLQRQRVHRDQHEIDGERDPPAAETQFLAADAWEERFPDRAPALPHAIAAVDSWKSSSMGAPAAR